MYNMGIQSSGSYFLCVTKLPNVSLQATKMQSMSNTSSVRKAETHVARMIFVMVIAFFIAWGPYAIFSLLTAFSDVQLSIESTIAPSLFAKSSVCYNPVIYFFLNSQVSAFRYVLSFFLFFRCKNMFGPCQTHFPNNEEIIFPTRC